jgi:hypothetical protein
MLDAGRDGLPSKQAGAPPRPRSNEWGNRDDLPVETEAAGVPAATGHPGDATPTPTPADRGEATCS